MILAKPVFAVLNDKTLALFTNENVLTLIDSVNIHRIDPPIIPKKW